jgi:MurNAc alpha-1-phosphate uridylyltransferase
MSRAMILAAGLGERMRPITDTRPKPLLRVGGKPLIAWQIERLVAAGFDDLVINVSHLAAHIEAALGDGLSYGATIRYSLEPFPLEVAGGIATALPLLGAGIVPIVSADVYTEYQYAGLHSRIAAMASTSEPPHVHMVMVPNPAYHREGDFVLTGDRLTLAGAPRLTFGNIALYRTSLFGDLPRGKKLKMLPHYEEWIGLGWASGELYTGPWANIGTPADLDDLDRLLRTPVEDR